MSVQAEWCKGCLLYVYCQANGAVMKGPSTVGMEVQNKLADGLAENCHKYSGQIQPGCILTYNADSPDLGEEYP